MRVYCSLSSTFFLLHIASISDKNVAFYHFQWLSTDLFIWFLFSLHGKSKMHFTKNFIHYWIQTNNSSLGLFPIISLTVGRYPIEFSFSSVFSLSFFLTFIAFITFFPSRSPFVSSHYVNGQSSLPNKIAIPRYFTWETVSIILFYATSFYAENRTKSLNSIMLIDCGAPMRLSF